MNSPTVEGQEPILPQNPYNLQGAEGVKVESFNQAPDSSVANGSYGPETMRDLIEADQENMGVVVEGVIGQTGTPHSGETQDWSVPLERTERVKLGRGALQLAKLAVGGVVSVVKRGYDRITSEKSTNPSMIDASNVNAPKSQAPFLPGERQELYTGVTRPTHAERHPEAESRTLNQRRRLGQPGQR